MFGWGKKTPQDSKSQVPDQFTFNTACSAISGGISQYAQKETNLLQNRQQTLVDFLVKHPGQNRPKCWAEGYVCLCKYKKIQLAKKGVEQANALSNKYLAVKTAIEKGEDLKQSDELKRIVHSLVYIIVVLGLDPSYWKILKGCFIDPFFGADIWTTISSSPFVDLNLKQLNEFEEANKFDKSGDGKDYLRSLLQQHGKDAALVDEQSQPSRSSIVIPSQDNSNAIKENDEWKKKYDFQKEELDKVKRENDQFRVKSNTLSADCDNLHDNNEEQHSRIKKLESDQHKWSQEKKEMDGEIANLKKQVVNLQNANEALQNQLTPKDARLQKLEAELVAQKEQNNLLKTKDNNNNDLLTFPKLTAEIERLKKELKDLPPKVRAEEKARMVRKLRDGADTIVDSVKSKWEGDRNR